MYTVSDILEDIDRGCMAHNMVENMFSYRIIFYVNGETRAQSTMQIQDTQTCGQHWKISCAIIFH